jgi:hypothetical protein
MARPDTRRLWPNSRLNSRRTTLFLVLAVSILLISSVVTQAQTCGSSNNIGWMTGRTRDNTGRIKVTVNYAAGPYSPGSVTEKVMREAVAEWNTFSCTTGVVFGEVQSGGDLAFYYTTDEDLTVGCAAYSNASYRIITGLILWLE